MKTLKLLLATAAVGVIVIAFRDLERGVWLLPGGSGANEDGGEEEPVLGYDGMDVDTLLDWLAEARLDREALIRMRDYEASHLDRQVVLSAIEDAL